MANKSILLFSLLFVFILSFSMVSATDSDLTIVPANDPYFLFNQSQDFKFHTFNSTNEIVPDSSLTCSGRFVDTEGNGFGVSSIATYSTYSKFSLYASYTDIPDSTLTYSIWCSSTSGETGFVSGSLQITETSENQELSSGLLIILIIIPLIIALLFVLGTAFLSEQHAILRLVSYLLVLPLSWVSFHFGTISLAKYVGFAELQEAIGATMFWTGWVFFALIAYIVIYIIYVAFQTAAQKRKARLEY